MFARKTKHTQIATNHLAALERQAALFALRSERARRAAATRRANALERAKDRLASASAAEVSL